MRSVAGRPWDMYRAELADTIRGQQSSRPALPCVYCSAPTKSVYQVCCAHSDLIDLDPGHPAALVEARTPANAGACAGALRPPVRASTSASALAEPDEKESILPVRKSAKPTSGLGASSDPLSPGSASAAPSSAGGDLTATKSGARRARQTGGGSR